MKVTKVEGFLILLMISIPLFLLYKSSHYSGPGSFLENLYSNIFEGNYKQVSNDLFDQNKGSFSQAPHYPDTVIKNVKEKFTLWDMEYEVTSVEIFHPVYDIQKTTGKYIGIKIKVTNDAKSDVGVSKIYIEDSKGRQYQPAMIGYQQLDVEDYGWNKIQSGFTKTLGVIFEIPKDSEGLKLDYPSAQGPVVVSVKLGL
ncbi:MAG: hypothetical protein JWP09_882 [Candidatus Taylorbacteria bacterium]|nr:hypothetical protein [Candidatus Taylorbacteria bacterium]